MDKTRKGIIFFIFEINLKLFSAKNFIF